MFRQELTETALALEEKRRAMRRCFEDMEVQRLAFESRAAAAAAEAQTAAAVARNAKTLQRESIQAKEAVHQLHRQAKDVHMICTCCFICSNNTQGKRRKMQKIKCRDQRECE